MRRGRELDLVRRCGWGWGKLKSWGEWLVLGFLYSYKREERIVGSLVPLKAAPLGLSPSLPPSLSLSADWWWLPTWWLGLVSGSSRSPFFLSPVRLGLERRLLFLAPSCAISCRSRRLPQVLVFQILAPRPHPSLSLVSWRICGGSWEGFGRLDARDLRNLGARGRRGGIGPDSLWYVP